MDCPDCKTEMEFEELKNFHGTWSCECGYEAEGSKIPCGADEGMIVDYEETIGEEVK